MANSVYDDILGLLGKFEDDPKFVDLKSKLGAFPLIRGAQTSHQYWFLESGFALFAGSFGDNNRLVFVGATISARSIITAEGRMEPFAGQLPLKLSAEDSRESVRAKVGKAPITPSDVDEEVEGVDTYIMSKFEFKFTFEKLAEKLTGFLVTLNGDEVIRLMDEIAASKAGL